MMKRIAFNQRLRHASYMAAFLGAACSAGSVQAVPYHYDANGGTAGTGGTGAWDTASALWRTPTDTDPLTTWPGAGVDNDAVFGGTAGTVTVGAGINANDIIFNTTGYTLSGSPITLNGVTPTITIASPNTATIGSVLHSLTPVGLNKDGTGTVVLTNTNTYTGTTNVNAGVLQIGNGTTVGAINNSALIDIDAGATLRWFRNDNAELTPFNNHAGAGTIHYLGVNDAGANLTLSRYTLSGQDNTAFTGTMIAEKTRINATQANDFGSALLQVNAGGQFLFNNMGAVSNDVVINDSTGWFESAGNLSALRYSGTVNHSGDIALNHTNQVINGDNSGKNSVITAFSASTVNLSGVISGTGEFSMGRFTSWNGGSVQAVNITLSGTDSNTYTGKTIVDGQGAVASLILAKTGGAIAIQGGNVVQFGSVTGGQANLRMGANEQFGTTSGGVEMNFVNVSGQWMRFDLLGTTQTLAGINTGNITTQGSGVVQNGGVNVGAAAAATLTLNGSGNYVFNGHMRNFDNVNSGGVFNLIKNGSGTQTLVGGVVSHTGTTVVNSGSLILQNTNAFNSATTVNNGAVLTLANTANIGTGGGFTIALNNGGTLVHNGQTNGNDFYVVNGAVTNSGITTINQNSVANLTGANKSLFLDGGLRGTGIVTINAANAGNGVIFRNNNTNFSGKLIVNGIASSVVNVGSGIGVGGNTSGLINADIELNGTMELLNQGIGWAASAPGDFFMGALSGNGVMVGNFTGGGQTRVRIGNNNNSGVYAGTIVDGTGNVIVLTKNGTGTQTFTGANTFTGGTTVAFGTLLVNNTTGSGLGTGNVVVNAGATLGGTGSFTGNASIATNAFLSPGGNGILESLGTGNLTFANNAIYNWDFLGSAADVTNVLGSITFGGNLTLAVNSLDGFQMLDTMEYVLFTYTGADPTLPNINFTGTGGQLLRFRVDEATNRILTSVIVPEPATMSLLAFGSLALLRRRRGV